MSSLKTIAKTAIVAATLAVGSLASLGATAGSAEAGPRLSIEIGGPGFHIGIGDRRWDRPYRPGYGYRRCTPRKALRKARRMGLRRAFVRRASYRGVVVMGKRGYRGRVIVGFGGHRSCPVRFVRPRYR
ncbi:MAG: hypothetical protein AAFO73_04055 [Pseudomonadota bacterium]